MSETGVMSVNWSSPADSVKILSASRKQGCVLRIARKGRRLTNRDPGRDQECSEYEKLP